jgi:phosphomannomutase
VALGGDLRPSTGRIVTAVAKAASDAGLAVVHGGRVPSPALALYGFAQGVPSIMVTGSHIPDDRNGIKFNTPSGEIMKLDEQGIRARRVDLPDAFTSDGALRPEFAGALPPVDPAPARAYVARWLEAFPRDLLAGRRIGVYGHSTVGRELLVEILAGLGAEVLRLGWSDRFVPVDTEAIRPEDAALARDWAREHGLFSLVSSDGDADRPLVADEHGKFLRGDVAGVLTARFLGASFVAAPVSCNTLLERVGLFKTARTRIGSPFVIEAMQAALDAGESRVVGFEANGGFLTGSPLRVPGGGELAPLMTRDPVIVHLAILAEAVRAGGAPSTLLVGLPARFTASDRLSDFPNERARALIASFREGGAPVIERGFPELGPVERTDELDGLRIYFESGDIVHIRASGNAPELRCYVEASSEARAEELLAGALAKLSELGR